MACCRGLQSAQGKPDAARVDRHAVGARAAAVFAAYLAAYYADDWQRGCELAEVSLL